ncbi:low molecular weight phosphotyrosine protein phosphatase [Leptospira fainei serovar Hurstbridge str. BUT 6]|uniref:protein-tyrosine-phosphatase n=1 Tax=Leptospira fainei serovar Hurstbridge str. BUT 6 TaxID=1193011 RepID=S3V8L3_9LEPT|nr:low molecular weight protein-tyrosine-phosphatase [Leptospira fainei]EPG72765.1 low molecular weight phosphotyrosine protein phosphatase [Leptospira fainei serovar Hurstbridge str. BUT 6]
MPFSEEQGFENKIRVLFVCLGNICRSPAAEGAFQDLVQRRGIERLFEIDSCGTSQYHIGELPDLRTRQTARKRGIELTHRARQFKKSDFEDFDFVLAMDRSNLRDLLSLTSGEEERKKVHLFRKFQKGEVKDHEVPDPYYGTLKDFEEVLNIVSEASEGFLEFILNKNGARNAQ